MKPKFQILFFNTIKNVKLADYEYVGTQQYKSGKVFLNFSGEDKGLDDPRGPYTTLFHEIGHTADDQAKEDIFFFPWYGAESGKESVQYLAEQDLYLLFVILYAQYLDLNDGKIYCREF